MLKIFTVISLIILISSCDEEANLSLENNHLNYLFSKSTDDQISDWEKKVLTDSIYKLIYDQKSSKPHRDNLFKVANRYYNLRDYKLYKDVTSRILFLSSRAYDSIHLAKAYSYMGDYYQAKQQADSSLYYYLNAKKIYSQKDMQQEVANNLLLMATVKITENDWRGAETHAIQSLEIFRLLGNKNKVSKAYNILGAISHNLDDYELAITMYTRAAEEYSEDEFNKVNCHREILIHNIATVLIDQEKFREASDLYNVILSPYIFKNVPGLYASALSHYATCQNKLFPNSHKPKIWHKRAVFLSDSLQLPVSSVVTRYKYADFCLSRGDIDEANSLGKQALARAKPLGDRVLTLRSLEKLILTDPNNASAYSKEYIALNDSLQIAERKIRNKFARIEFETDQLQIERDRAIVDSGAFYNMFFIFLILIGAITYWVYRRMGYSLDQEAKFQARADGELFDSLAIQRSKVMEGRIFEKERISRELHDGVLNDLSFVRNSLAIVIDKGDLSSKLKGCKKYLNQLQIIEKEIHTISHDLKGSNILKAQSFRKLVDDFCELQHTASEINWSFEHDVAIKWKKVNSKLKVNIYRILQEAVQNINRHSYASYASIYIFLKEGKIHIHISDDGIGFKSATKAMGTGLKNIQTRADLQGGHVEIQAIKGEGMKIFLEFPY